MSNSDEYTEDIDIDIEEPKKPQQKRVRPVKNVDVLQWVRTRTGKQRKTAQFKRVVAGLDKHPHASLYELQHGVGSKAAKAYRERQTPQGAGRVDYAEITQAMNDAGLVAIVGGDYVGADKLILARDDKKVYAYGGVIRYNPELDRGITYDGLAGRVVLEIKSRLHGGK